MEEQLTPPPEDVSNLISEETRAEDDSLLGSRLATLSSSQMRYDDETDFLLIEQLNSTLTQNRGERVKYAKYTFWLTVAWITSVILIVFFSGFNYHCERVLNLSDSTIITLISTTTVNVFGFFLLVMQFLFNKEELKALGYLRKKKKEKATPRPA